MGKLKEAYLREGIAEYQKRLKNMISTEIVELPDEKIPENPSEKEKEAVKNREGEKILARIADKDKVFILAIEGKLLSSEELAQLVKENEIYGTSVVTFVIGGSLGLSDAVYRRANAQLSFGRMTLPHQLMRLVLIEQIYRTQMINRGAAYHK